MKEKILKQLKTTYKDLGFSEKTLSGASEFLSATITEESKIEEGLKGIEPLLKLFQGEQDKLRTEIKKLKTQKEEPTNDPKPKNEEIPEWIKPFFEKLENLEKNQEDNIKKSTFDSKKMSAKKKLIEDKKLDNGLCDEFLSLFGFREDVTDDDIVDFVVSKHDSFKAKFTPEAGKPSVGNGVGKGVIPESISDFLKEKKSEIESKNKN
jgi:hypothetical protein